MNMAISSETEALLRRELDAGRFASPEEAVEFALRAISTLDDDKVAKLKRLREDIALGLKDVADGNVRELDVDAVIARGKAAISARGAR
jgi:Arc/MetJ-type ribon-helix-helix transcriptional regulator